jgi:hypothetical protein
LSDFFGFQASRLNQKGSNFFSFKFPYSRVLTHIQPHGARRPDTGHIEYCCKSKSGPSLLSSRHELRSHFGQFSSPAFQSCNTDYIGITFEFELEPRSLLVGRLLPLPHQMNGLAFLFALLARLFALGSFFPPPSSLLHFLLLYLRACWTSASYCLLMCFRQ